MERRALTRGGALALLAALAVYVLLGGELTLPGGDDSTESTVAAETTTTAEAPPPTPTDTEATPQEPQGETTTAPEGAPPAGTVPEDEVAEVSRVLVLIEAGGPFPHEQDGTTFDNRERLLPQQPSGHYREYTVETPGSPDRGARRLVVGGAGETFYTRDHYRSFIQIDPAAYR